MSKHDHDEVRPYASPVCYAHEFETNPLQSAEMVAFLNGLLEGERAGAQGLIDMSKTCNDATLKQLLLDVARDEGRYCVMLRSHVQRLRRNADRRYRRVLRKTHGSRRARRAIEAARPRPVGRRSHDRRDDAAHRRRVVAR